VGLKDFFGDWFGDWFGEIYDKLTRKDTNSYFKAVKFAVEEAEIEFDDLDSRFKDLKILTE